MDIREHNIDDILANCLLDIKVCCGTIFSDIFYADFSILHDKIFKLINTGHKKIAIAAPRGIGKTSIARATVMRSILFRLQHFIVYVSNSATSAEMQTENIKRDLITNKFVREFFGNIKESLDVPAGMDESFAKTAWTAFGSTLVLPRGAGQQVRGLNWSNYRPEIVIIDDLEDKDEIRSEDNRKKLKTWFYSDLMKTEDRYGDGCIFIYIDTIKHEDSLLVELLESPQWASVQLSICDANYNTLDSNYMTTEEIKAEVAEARRIGDLDTFYMERMNIPISQEDKIFKDEYFRYFQDYGDTITFVEDGKKKEIRTSRLIHVTIVDPAKTVKIQSAETSVQTIAIDTQSRKIFVRDIVSKRMYPDEIYDEMFDQVVRYRSMMLGYESTGLGEFIIQPIENECRVRGITPILVELKAKKGINEKGKVERIKTLGPLYRLGYMYHNESNCGPLEGQLRTFPRSKLWDVMDGLAYITHIMDKFAVYFDPSDEWDYEGLQEEDYLDLECEDALTADQMGFLL